MLTREGHMINVCVNSFQPLCYAAHLAPPSSSLLDIYLCDRPSAGRAWLRPRSAGPAVLTGNRCDQLITDQLGFTCSTWLPSARLFSCSSCSSADPSLSWTAGDTDSQQEPSSAHTHHLSSHLCAGTSAPPAAPRRPSS